MPVEYRVEHNQEGQRTLKERVTGDRCWSVVQGNPQLINNPDQASFYREVAGQIAALAQKGIKIFYRDAAK